MTREPFDWLERAHQFSRIVPANPPTWDDFQTMRAVEGSLIEHLLQLKRAAVTEPASSPSSAPTTGPVTKLREWPPASQDFWGTRIQKAITDLFKSMPFIETELEATWIDSSTLQLMLRWPTPSIETGTAGEPGEVHAPVMDSEPEQSSECVHLWGRTKPVFSLGGKKREALFCYKCNTLKWPGTRH